MRRNPESHRAILQAAADLITEKGYCAVTIDEIALRAGVGKQTIYRWWKAKIEIYIELYDTIARQNIKPIDSGDFKSDVELYAKGLYAQLTHPVASLAFRGMVSEAQGSAESLALFRSYMLGRFELTRSVMKRAIERGEIAAKTDTDALSSIIGGAVVWRVLLNDKVLDSRFIKRIVNFAVAGILNQ